ncbi:SseB family protein [Nocardioides sp. cx-173]|uniref:SseB family protein n=1 Tax=Nocardioides sp. cx-173 TaxID=2898796 RepID=UPI001E5D0A4D|nr:SseB family protein [Nocardioides sp. cx-173]MCD4526114.1 SseB family protein [Nocardioides sp. cx-173]UGB43804.1 SseB family protein [Nocardioides sp. cx-173]
MSDRRLLGPGFPDDAGEADPALRAALAAYDDAAALAAIARSRLLVPVVAVLGEVEVGEDGLARDKTSDMAAVLLEGADGRLAMLAFTGLDSLAAWDPEARPVPVTARTAAQSALQEEAAALVVDVAGPATFVLEGDDLLGVASGWTLTTVGGRSAWLRPS